MSIANLAHNECTTCYTKLQKLLLFTQYSKVTLKRFLTQASTLLEIWQDYREETEKEARGIK